ncbi:conserved protein of unknown function (plasmid) [Rhodovastum atsumiense]|uniref:Uncharacterized protein n=1 Tax=Rhodovastum atsumiense TaxID=504468 RepID=A0A5M6IMX1_9PROT|nr:hypothetical protein [Rhodovastum atsumiense]KAA5609592.1 hypothetical protein F1189_23495 [Rhodovastum atsumiense]CAH2606358.1 conserved protein of unknown function [Rhodovastum atsumiense]
MLDALIAWVQTHAGRPMLSAGVLLIAFMMLTARISLGVIAIVAGGGLLFANYAAIVGMFGF